MSTSSSPAHEFVAVPPSLDTEPPYEWKCNMIKQINTNLQKLFQDADELHRFRLKDFRSDEELGRLKEDHNLEIRRIHALGAEEYRVQLELECQRRKWVFKGQPIDAKRWDVLDARISQYFQRSQVRRSDQHPRFRTSYLERTICPIITCEV